MCRRLMITHMIAVKKVKGGADVILSVTAMDYSTIGTILVAAMIPLVLNRGRLHRRVEKTQLKKSQHQELSIVLGAESCL